jgi:hypothetical protein
VTLLRQRVCRLTDSVFVPVGQCDRRAGFCEGARRGQAQSRCGAGDERYLIRERNMHGVYFGVIRTVAARVRSLIMGGRYWLPRYLAL